jgi:HEPN superfamily RiboL-PSP-like protein
VNKIHPKFNQKTAREAPKGPVYKQTMRYCEEEIRPLLDLLKNQDTSPAIKMSLKRFLIISLISTFEFYFKYMTSNYVDSNNADLTKLFSDEICFKLSDLDAILKDNSITKGNILISSVKFSDLHQIINFISNLLEIDLFKYLYNENTKDKCKMMIRNAPPIDINYQHLFEAYELRNKVVHRLSDVPYSYTRILNLWDNAMNIFEIANTIFMLPQQLQQFRLQYRREATKK